MNDDPMTVHNTIESGELDTDDRALAFYAELTESGVAAEPALASAAARFPAQSGLLADYAVHVTGLGRQTPDPAVTDPLADMVSRLASAKAPMLGLLKRIDSLGMRYDDFCRRMHIDQSILTKLDRGLIFTSTIPDRLVRELANLLSAPVDSVSKCLANPPRLSRASEYNSRVTPRSSRVESFASAVDAAVQNGHLPASERNYWLERRR
jgi:hypothetical protein